MTVGELIEILKTKDPNAQVFSYTGGGNGENWWSPYSADLVEEMVFVGPIGEEYKSFEPNDEDLPFEINNIAEFVDEGKDLEVVTGIAV